MIKEDITETFIFLKGEDDWKTWSRVNDFIYDYFTRKRNAPYKVLELKKNYRIIVSIENIKLERD